MYRLTPPFGTANAVLTSTPGPGTYVHDYIQEYAGVRHHPALPDTWWDMTKQIHRSPRCAADPIDPASQVQ
jgi:hypothetical protein